MEITSAGVKLWCSTTGYELFIRWEETPAQEFDLVWAEGQRLGNPKTIWERLSEEE